ncbi:hypothetical protein ACLB1O_08370 [Escherichia coli]
MWRQPEPMQWLIHAADRKTQIQAEACGVANDRRALVNQLRHHCQTAFRHRRGIFKQFAAG